MPYAGVDYHHKFFAALTEQVSGELGDSPLYETPPFQ